MQAISDKLSQSLVWQKRLQDPFWVEFCNSEFPPPPYPASIVHFRHIQVTIRCSSHETGNPNLVQVLTRISGPQLCWQTEVLCRYGRTELGVGGKSLWRMLSCRFAPKFAFWTSSILALDIVIYTYMYDINANLTKVWVSTFNSDFLSDFFHRPPFGDGFNHVLLLLLFLVNDPIWLQ